MAGPRIYWPQPFLPPTDSFSPPLLAWTFFPAKEGLTSRESLVKRTVKGREAPEICRLIFKIYRFDSLLQIPLQVSSNCFRHHFIQTEIPPPAQNSHDWGSITTLNSQGENSNQQKLKDMNNKTDKSTKQIATTFVWQALLHQSQTWAPNWPSKQTLM